MNVETRTVSFNEEELQKYLLPRRIVVVSTVLATARTIKKMMVQLGAKNDQVFVFDRFDDAKKDILTTPTHILISDLFFEGNDGLELVEIQQKSFENKMEVSSVIICADPSDATVGMMAEASVDGVLIKPFNFASFRLVMLQALTNKVKPSRYWQTLEKAKTLFFKKEFEQAIPIFESTKDLDPCPIHAFYYLGLIYQEKEDYERAIRTLEEGLSLDEKDFLCLTAIFDIRMRRLEYALAYEVAARIHKYHPVSTNRILSLVKLSVYNKKFMDILDYYQIFKQIKKRDAFLNRVVIASMLVCSKYFLLRKEKEKNLQVLEDVSKLALETETLRADVFRYFTESSHFEEAGKYFSQLPKEFQELPEIRLLYLEYTYASGQDANVIQQGTYMLKEGMKSFRVYELMIDSSKKMKRSPEKIEDLIKEAELYFPNRH